jgi:large subunit ribosomal protein L1
MLSGSAPAASDEGSAAVAEGSGIPPIRFITPTPKPKNMAFDEALDLCRVGAKWNETFELYIRVSTHDKNKKKGKARDPFRGICILPNAYKPAKQIVVLTNEDDQASAAKEAGAVVGDTDLIPDVVNETVGCDTLLATPDILKFLKPYGRELGRRMPSVKRGTVSEDIGSLVRQYINGVPYKSDVFGNVNLGLGKVEFTNEQLQENIAEIVKSIDDNRLSARGKFIMSITLSRTQGGSFPLRVEQFTDELKKSGDGIF